MHSAVVVCVVDPAIPLFRTIFIVIVIVLGVNGPLANMFWSFHLSVDP